DGEQPIAEVAVHDLFGEKIERGTGLLEEHPEQAVEDEHDQHRDHLVARHRAFARAFDKEECGKDEKKYTEYPNQRARAQLGQQVMIGEKKLPALMPM